MSAIDRVIAELMDRRLLNDVDEDLHQEIGGAVVKAVGHERLEAALRRIADMCPATQEMTLAHQMAQEAEEALGVDPRH